MLMARSLHRFLFSINNEAQSGASKFRRMPLVNPILRDDGVYVLSSYRLFGNAMPVLPLSGVKLETECESRIDLKGLSIRLFVMTLTSLSVRLRSECTNRLEMCKSPLAIGVLRSMMAFCYPTTLRECCNY